MIPFPKTKTEFVCTWPGGDTRLVTVAGFSCAFGDQNTRVRWTETPDELDQLLGTKPAASMKREAWVPEAWLSIPIP